MPWVLLTLTACSLIGFSSSISSAILGFVLVGKRYGWFHTRGTWGVGFFPGVVGGLLYAIV